MKIIIVGELKKLNETCEPLLDQCLPGLTCVHRVRTEERMRIPNTNQFYERIEHRNKRAMCRPGKGSVDKFTSIYVYVSSCKLIAIIIEDEGENCESDKDCQEELTCMKYVRVEHVNQKEDSKGRLQYRLFDNRQITHNIGKCKRGPGSVANLFIFQFVLSIVC